MATLESSWVLEDRLKQIVCPEALKTQILEYISHNPIRAKLGYSNITYRANLHYIEDNIGKEWLPDQVKLFNDKIQMLIEKHENDEN